MHPDLHLAGSLPSLDMPHHLRKQEWCRYREGVTVAEISDKQKEKRKRKIRPTHPGRTLVDTGLGARVFLPEVIPLGTRVTVRFKDVNEPQETPNDEVLAAVVAPSIPRTESGFYWGYEVRPAPSLSAVLTECPFDGGYDVTFGTSERGIALSTLNESKSKKHRMPEYSHMLIVFGGLAGLEVAVRADKELEKLGITKPEVLFDYWVNLCPGQGSRTIRTEEAVWLGLMGLKDYVQKNGNK